MSNILGKIFGTGAKEVVNSVGSVLDNLITTKAEKEAAKLEIEKEINRHFEALQSNATKELELELGDKANARGMQAEALKQSDLFSKRFVYYFTTFWSLFSAGYLIGTTFVEIPEKNSHVVDTTLGFLLGTAIALMFSFFYGTSLKENQRSENKIVK